MKGTSYQVGMFALKEH